MEVMLASLSLAPGHSARCDVGTHRSLVWLKCDAFQPKRPLTNHSSFWPLPLETKQTSAKNQSLKAFLQSIVLPYTNGVNKSSLHFVKRNFHFSPVSRLADLAVSPMGFLAAAEKWNATARALPNVSKPHDSLRFW